MGFDEVIDDALADEKVPPVAETPLLVSEAEDPELDIVEEAGSEEACVVEDEVSVVVEGSRVIVVRPNDPSGYVVNASVAC